MREWENFCVGCPQGCINCGRKEDVLVITCDCCGDYIENDNFETIDDYDFCEKCISRALEDNNDDWDSAIDDLFRRMGNVRQK